MDESKRKVLMKIKEQWLIPHNDDEYCEVLILTENNGYYLGEWIQVYGHTISKITNERANELLLAI